MRHIFHGSLSVFLRHLLDLSSLQGRRVPASFLVVHHGHISVLDVCRFLLVSLEVSMCTTIFVLGEWMRLVQYDRRIARLTFCVPVVRCA
jgi:hypothetical protein